MAVSILGGWLRTCCLQLRELFIILLIFLLLLFPLLILVFFIIVFLSLLVPLLLRPLILIILDPFTSYSCV